MPAVSNSSPLIVLAAIGRLQLLPRLYDRVVVPPAVWHEIVVAGSGRAGAAELPHLPWLRRDSVSSDVEFPRSLASLDPGEAEAIRLVLTYPRSVPILLDDLSARRAAERLGLSVSGTVGVLLLAKHTGLIAEVGPPLQEARAAGLYLSDAAVERSLSLAGER